MPEQSSAQGAPAVILGLEMPSVDRWSTRIVTALGQNPSAFTGPGTNTFLVGTGEERILLDAGDGRAEYLPVLEEAMKTTGCRGIQEIVLTHGHPDHLGGVQSLLDRFGRIRVSKMPFEAFDAYHHFDMSELCDGDILETEGATLRALHTPGHAPDHFCFHLQEENGIFTGDNVLGLGTTVISAETGDLGQYLASLERLLAELPTRLFPAHGPLEEYIGHRLAREQQIIAVLERGLEAVPDMVASIYAAYPPGLHAAAAQSVTSHLRKLEAEERVECRERGDQKHWRLC